MQMKLKVVGGANEGQEVPISAPKFLIGRARDCHLRANSDMISRHHCVLLVEADLAAVRDFGSRNGTFVNGEKVQGECRLHSGDHLEVGPLKFEVVLSVVTKGKKRPKVQDVSDAVQRSVGSDGLDEMDMADFLSQEEDTVSMRAQAADDTTEEAAAATVAGESESEETTRNKKGAIKLPAIEAEDSTAAAAEFLRRMNRRR